MYYYILSCIIIYYYILLCLIIFYYILLYITIHHNHYRRINLRFQYIWMDHIFKKSCCTVALLHCCTVALLHCCTVALLHWASDRWKTRWLCQPICQLVNMSWVGDGIVTWRIKSGQTVLTWKSRIHRAPRAQRLLPQLQQPPARSRRQPAQPQAAQPAQVLDVLTVNFPQNGANQVVLIVTTSEIEEPRTQIHWRIAHMLPFATHAASVSRVCGNAELYGVGTVGMRCLPSSRMPKQPAKWKVETLWETLSSEKLWDALSSEVRGKWSCELCKENVGSTCWQHSTTGWCIHPWPWLQWSGSGEFANFRPSDRPFFGMWQCLKVDLRFTWFTWFTILFCCVLHFYILVRISSNVGFWIRFDLWMAFLPHITSASATARGGTSILGLCIARPSSSTAHAAPGLRCGRFQLTLTLRENLLVAIVFVTEFNISRF